VYGRFSGPPGGGQSQQKKQQWHNPKDATN
jgi:hypothetical protein